MHNRIMIDINIILPLIWVFIKFVKGIRIYGRPRGRKKKTMGIRYYLKSQNKRNRYTSSEDELYTGLSCYVLWLPVYRISRVQHTLPEQRLAIRHAFFLWNIAPSVRESL